MVKSGKRAQVAMFSLPDSYKNLFLAPNAEFCIAIALSSAESPDFANVLMTDSAQSCGA
jgi:hypothetical protein